jgi:hypothetical protein
MAITINTPIKFKIPWRTVCTEAGAAPKLITAISISAQIALFV